MLGEISTPAGEDEGAGEGENGEAKTTLQLDVLKLFAEMSSFCGELEKPEHHTQIVFNSLLVGGSNSLQNLPLLCYFLLNVAFFCVLFKLKTDYFVCLTLCIPTTTFYVVPFRPDYNFLWSYSVGA